MQKTANTPTEKFFSSKSILLLLFIAIAIFTYGLGKKLWRRHLINQEISSLQSEISRLEQKNSEVARLINYLDSGDYAEREARLKLNMQKPGEQVAVILNQKKLETANTVEMENLSIPQKWVKYFFQ